MAHLGADVAAFVDGQLSESAARAANSHLEQCETCRAAVRQQRLVKSRMRTVASPEPPAELIASLAELAATPPGRDSWWARARRSMPARAGIVVIGASLAVVVTAYLLGVPERAPGDEIAPPFDRYAAEFYGATTVQASHTISASTIQELDQAGWPCHPTLAGDLHRTSAAFADQGDVIALGYTNGRDTLNLYEQRGALDRSAVDGFRPEVVGGSRIWVRAGDPLIATWDDAGVVYTVVTDIGDDRLARAIEQLPRRLDGDDGMLDRIGDGLGRMTAWADTA